MHLALNYQRVDPSRGGAETYVADLCRHLVLDGHRVDLYAESWAADCLPHEVNVVPVPAAGSEPTGADLELRPEFRVRDATGEP